MKKFHKGSKRIDKKRSTGIQMAKGGGNKQKFTGNKQGGGNGNKFQGGHK